MPKLIAAHVWVCEWCDLPLYDVTDMEIHMRQKHHITDREFGYAGDDMIVAEVGLKCLPLTIEEQQTRRELRRRRSWVYWNFYKYVGRHVPSDLWSVAITVVVCLILGAWLGYWIGAVDAHNQDRGQLQPNALLTGDAGSNYVALREMTP